MRISMAGVLLMALALSACDQSPGPTESPRAEPQPPVEQPLGQSGLPQVEPEPSAPEQKQVQAVPAKSAIAAQEKAVRPAAPDRNRVSPDVSNSPTKPVLPALDLSVPEEILLAPSAVEAVPLEPLLPAFFTEKSPEQSSFQLHGKLISNERIDDYLDSLEGAELHFEFKQ